LTFLPLDPPFDEHILVFQVGCQALCCAMVAGSPESEVSEDDHVSDWGNDAAVYSSDSELSDWEELRDSHAAYTDSQSHSQAVQQTAAGKTSLCNLYIRAYAC